MRRHVEYRCRFREQFYLLIWMFCLFSKKSVMFGVQVALEINLLTVHWFEREDGCHMWINEFIFASSKKIMKNITNY